MKKKSLRLVPILMAIMMVFTMMPMLSRTVYADDPVYTVTLDPGEGSGDPIVFKSDVNWYESTSDNGSDVPGGNFYRDLEDGKIWFRFPDYKVPDTFTAPDDYLFDRWEPDLSPGGFWPMSGNLTITAQWKKDPSLLPESSYSLSPTSYTITQAGYTDIECVVTSFEKGKIESNGQQIEVDAIQFTLNKGTLTDGNGNSIPFLVDAMWHFGPSDSESINTIGASNESFTAAVFINENDFNAAAPGTYTGTFQIDSTWIDVNWEEVNGNPHSIALTLIVPDPSKSHTVTYEVVSGTWADGTTTPKTEEVEDGQSPSQIPTGMIASEGFEGGAWSPNPSGATITDTASFTYTFTAKQNPPEPVTVTGITLNSDSAKKDYTEGDTLDVTGLTLEVSKSDGSKETVSVTAAMVSGFDSSKTGRQTLTVSYEGFTDTYEIEVKAKTNPPAPDPVSYSVTNGNGGEWTKGNKNTLGFTFKRSVDDGGTYELFTGIKIDGKSVTEKDASGKANWTAKSGSVIIDLQPSFLETLSVGKHTLIAEFEDGSATAEFMIKAAKKDDEGSGSNSGVSAKTTTAPKTGDENNMLRWLLCLSSSAVALWITTRRKMRQK